MDLITGEMICIHECYPHPGPDKSVFVKNMSPCNKFDIAYLFAFPPDLLEFMLSEFQEVSVHTLHKYIASRQL